MKEKDIKELQEKELFFKPEEVNRLVIEAKKIGFEPLPLLVKEKEFNPETVRATLSFKHVKSENELCFDRGDMKFAGFNVMNDNVTDMFFTMLFNELDSAHQGEDY